MVITPKLADFVKDDGTSNVFIYIYDPTTRTKAKIKTEFYVKPSEWTGSEVYRKRPNAMYINPKLKANVAEIENFVFKNPSYTPAQIRDKHMVRSDLSPAAYFRYYIEECRDGKIVKKGSKDRMSDGYLKALGTSCAKLEAYGSVTWSRITEEFLDTFVSWLRDKCYKQNTIAKYVKYIVIIYNYARKKKIHNGDVLEYYVNSEKSQKIRLTPKEVEDIINLDLTDAPELVAEHERFQVAYSLLLRFGDTIAINEKNIIIKNKKAYLSAFTKKGRKEILLPIKKSVYKILKKNNFNIRATNTKSNEKLKLLGMKAKINSNVTFTEFKNGVKTEVIYKKYQKIETHTTRRSAARNLFDAGLEPEIIMVLGGWTAMKQLLEYIDIDLDYAAKKASEHPFFD